MLDQVYERTKQIVIENKEKLSQLAELLLEREVIFTEDVENIFGKRKFANKEQEEALYATRPQSPRLTPPPYVPSQNADGAEQPQGETKQENAAEEAPQQDTPAEEAPKEDK